MRRICSPSRREFWASLPLSPAHILTSTSYPLSKLATTFATRHLARVVAPLDQNGSGVIINLVCPGLCVTTLGRNASPEHAERLRNLHKNFGRTAEDGSRTLLHAAVAGPESHGHLLHSCADGE